MLYVKPIGEGRGTPVAFLVQFELKKSNNFIYVVSGLFRNVVSSRSHSILQLLVEQCWVKGGSKKEDAVPSSTLWI